MPLHLLGKKSWNVYNTENIARVRRDEARAKAQEEEEERRMQEVDAERRIQILRGERPSTPEPLSPLQRSISRPDGKTFTDSTGGARKRRRLADENDTDRDIRIAREDAQLALAKREKLALSRKDDAPIQDSAGNINLFPLANTQAQAGKGSEAKKESSRKRGSYEDQSMRFSNAAGLRQNASKDPWYSSSQTNGKAPESMARVDVWGNEDPMRTEREKARMNSNDPLVAMKKGIRQLKTIEEERKQWNRERARELDALVKTKGRWESRENPRRRSTSQETLEGFNLDRSDDRHDEGKYRDSHKNSFERLRSHSRKHSSSKPHSQSNRHRHDRRHRHRHRSRDAQHTAQDADTRHTR